MRKYQWRIGYCGNGKWAASGEFEMTASATKAEVQAEAERIAKENLPEVDVIDLTRPEGPVDWDAPIEAVNFHEDGEEIGEARFLGVARDNAIYSQIVGISWNPPSESIKYAKKINGRVEREDDVYIRNKAKA